MDANLTGNRIFATGLEKVLNEVEFRKKFQEVEEQAFQNLFEMQSRKEVDWVRTGKDMRDFTALVGVKNALGKSISIPVFFHAYIDGNGHRNAFLTLGSMENAPCRNDADERVKNLFTELTGEEWKIKWPTS